MDWLRPIPIGQYVDGTDSWLRDLDSRLQLARTLAFLLTPTLAGPAWRLEHVAQLPLTPPPRRVEKFLRGKPWAFSPSFPAKIFHEPAIESEKLCA